MSALIRDAPLGQIVRWATKGRLYQYPEEQPGFVLPSSYNDNSSAPQPENEPRDAEKFDDERTPEGHSLYTPATIKDDPMLEAATSHSLQNVATLSEIMSRPDMSKTNTRADLEKAYTAAAEQASIREQPSRPIAPTKTADGTILVDWYTTDDPENPQNWTQRKKGVVVLQIYLYTLAVYIGSAIYTPSEIPIIQIFGVSQTVASLGLALYVLGYGTGPLLFSPLSEIPVIGRNPPYMITFGIFVILAVPTALVNNVPGLLVLRFLQGFFGSPCLATGGATLGDLTNLMYLPYLLCGWAAFATVGPALGPMISGFSVPATNWHWSLWEILWLAGPVFILMFTLLPETSSPNILLRRAKRIRALTGNPAYRSQSEIDQSKMAASTIVFENVVRPWQIAIFDPAVLFTAVYTAIIYSIFYSFFEVFPIVYIEGYGMNVGEMGLIFLSISVAVAIAIPSYFVYLRYVFEPEIRAHGLGAPERRLVPALYCAFFLPVGLFMFGWTGRPSIHWIVPTIGIVIFGIGIFIVLQCIFIYIPLTYPQYAASLFAGNDFLRSALAFAAILFSKPLFDNLGVAKGVSLLAGLTVGCIGGVFVLYLYGATLRARSKFAAK